VGKKVAKSGGTVYFFVGSGSVMSVSSSAWTSVNNTEHGSEAPKVHKFTIQSFSFLLVAATLSCGTTKFYGLPDGANKAEASEVELSPFISIRQVNGRDFIVAADVFAGGSSKVYFAPGSYDLALDWRDTNYHTTSTGIVVRGGYAAYLMGDGTIQVFPASGVIALPPQPGAPPPKPLTGEAFKHLQIVVEKGKRNRIVAPISDTHALWFDPPYQCVLKE
jgi:hypothetical protein